MKFQDDISNMNTYIHTYVRTYIHTDKPKPICPLLFQSWGHNDLITDLETHPGISDHYAVTYNVNLTVKQQKKPDRYVYQYRKGDLEGVKCDLGTFKDDFLSKEPLKRPVNDNWNLLKDALVSSIKKNIPQKKITSRWNLLWMTPEIKRLCRKKKRAWDAGRHNRHSHSWKRYLKLSKLAKEAIQESHRTYVNNILNVSINDNPKKFYSYVKQKKSGQSNIPVLRLDGNLLSDPTEVAEALNSQYTSKFTREPAGHLPDIDSEPVSLMPDIEFTAPGIEMLLNNLKPSKSSGPDLVPARILNWHQRKLHQY